MFETRDRAWCREGGWNDGKEDGSEGDEKSASRRSRVRT